MIAATGTEYYNIADFLVAVDKYRDMDKAMALLKDSIKSIIKATKKTSNLILKEIANKRRSHHSAFCKSKWLYHFESAL